MFEVGKGILIVKFYSQLWILVHEDDKLFGKHLMSLVGDIVEKQHVIRI